MPGSARYATFSTPNRSSWLAGGMAQRLVSTCFLECCCMPCYGTKKPAVRRSKPVSSGNKIPEKKKILEEGTDEDEKLSKVDEKPERNEQEKISEESTFPLMEEKTPRSVSRFLKSDDFGENASKVESSVFKFSKSVSWDAEDHPKMKIFGKCMADSLPSLHKKNGKGLAFFGSQRKKEEGNVSKMSSTVEVSQKNSSKETIEKKEEKEVESEKRQL